MYTNYLVIRGYLMSLPSLNSLRTFESAARLKSFALAAQELFVSPSAVSHQIRLLEQRLGVELFIRLDRKVALSNAGELFYPQVKLGITTLITATEQLRVNNEENNLLLKMSVVPFFATRWLLPKLADFKRLYPNCHLKVHTSTTASNFAQESLDLVIRRGVGPWLGMVSKLLCRERLAAVCSPELLMSIKRPQDLFRQPLLCNVEVMTEWQEWFETQGLVYQAPKSSFDFQNTSQILDACLSGAGVALIDPLMIHQHLLQGELVNIFNHSVDSIRSYFIVYPEQHRSQDKIHIFEQWLSDKMADDPLMLTRMPASK